MQGILYATVLITGKQQCSVQSSLVIAKQVIITFGATNPGSKIALITNRQIYFCCMQNPKYFFQTLLSSRHLKLFSMHSKHTSKDKTFLNAQCKQISNSKIFAGSWFLLSLITSSCWQWWVCMQLSYSIGEFYWSTTKQNF